MGEIAEDMLDGTCCEMCGCYFTEEHGYPAICWDCWEDLGEDQVNRQRAQHPTL